MAYVRACSNDRRVKPPRAPAVSISLSRAIHLLPHIAHQSPLTRSRRCTVRAMSPRSTQSSPCRNTAVFIKLLLTVFFTRLSPLSPFVPPFSSHHSPRCILFAASPSKIHLEIYILHVFNLRELSLSSPISRFPPSLSLSLFLRSFVKIQYMRFVT